MIYRHLVTPFWGKKDFLFPTEKQIGGVGTKGLFFWGKKLFWGTKGVFFSGEDAVIPTAVTEITAGSSADRVFLSVIPLWRHKYRFISERR